MDLYSLFVFFFFQAEDGIRDLTVTGVQTCALPIWENAVIERVQALERQLRAGLEPLRRLHVVGDVRVIGGVGVVELESESADYLDRSEERRVGKECRFRWSTSH